METLQKSYGLSSFVGLFCFIVTSCTIPTARIGSFGSRRYLAQADHKKPTSTSKQAKCVPVPNKRVWFDTCQVAKILKHQSWCKQYPKRCKRKIQTEVKKCMVTCKGERKKDANKLQVCMNSKARAELAFKSKCPTCPVCNSWCKAGLILGGVGLVFGVVFIVVKYAPSVK